MIKLKRIEYTLLFLVSFFAFSGYNAVIAIVLEVLGSDASRFFSVPLRLFTTACMGLLVVLGLRHAGKKGRWIYVLFIVFWVGYIFKVYLTSFQKDLYMPIQEYLLYSINFCVLPFLSFSFFGKPDQMKVILKGFIISGFVLGVIAVLFYSQYFFLGVGRITEVKYIDKSVETLSPLILSYAGVFNIAVGLSVIRFHKPPKRVVLFIWVTILLSLFMFALGASRGSVVSLVLFALYFVSIGNFRSKLKSLIYAVIGIIGILLVTDYSGSSVFERFLGISSGVERGTSDSIRIKLWKEGLLEFSQHPFFGGRIEVGDYYPHNIVVELLMATGLFGFILILVLTTTLIRRTVKVSRSNKGVVFVIAIFLVGLGESMFTGAIYNLTLFFLPLGMMLGVFNNRKVIYD